MEIKHVKDIDVSQGADILSIEIIDVTKRLEKELAEKITKRYLATV